MHVPRMKTIEMDAQRKRLGEDLLTPQDLGYMFDISPALSLPTISTAGRGIAIGIDCRAVQQYVSFKIIPRTSNPCPQPPISNPCGGDPPTCQQQQPLGSCIPIITPGPPCLFQPDTCQALTGFVPAPCFTPCGNSPLPPPVATCTSCQYPQCLTFEECGGGSVICGPAGSVTGLGVANCNPLAFAPACQDGCVPMGPPIPTATPTLSAMGRNITLTAAPYQTITPAQMLIDPQLPQWIPSPYCQPNIPCYLRYNQV